jgi:hypothetical protein
MLTLVLLAGTIAFGQIPLHSRLAVLDPVINDAVAQNQFPPSSSSVTMGR